MHEQKDLFAFCTYEQGWYRVDIECFCYHLLEYLVVRKVQPIDLFL